MGRRRGEEDVPRAALLETASHAFHGHVEAAGAETLLESSILSR
jgi:hypothetical protein